jgi:hypothetical protein
MSARESSNATRPVEDPAQFTRWPGLMSLALGIVVGPIVALVHQQTVYAVNMWACGRNLHATMHIVPVLALIVVLGAAYGGYLNWTAVGRGVEDEDGNVVTRTRFLALMGMAISVFSALVIVAQWFAIFMFDPCMRA